MGKTHSITLKAVSNILCQTEDGTYLDSSKIIKKGETITLNVPSAVTKATIFTQPDDSKYINDIISQFHANGLMISKKQLVSANWKVI